MNKINQTFARGIAVALLAVPAFAQAQSKLNMNDCTKITPAYQQQCAADNVMRTDCNKVSNPSQCYNTKKAGGTYNTNTTAQPSKPAAAPAAKPAATPVARPAAAAAPARTAAKCTGGMFTKPTKAFKALSELSGAAGGYLPPQNLAATSPTTAQTECSAICAATGEPAPCGWYTVVKLRNDFAKKIDYQCYMVNARSAKGIFVPKLATDQNLGSPAQPVYFQEAQSYPCTR